MDVVGMVVEGGCIKECLTFACPFTIAETRFFFKKREEILQLIQY